MSSAGTIRGGFIRYEVAEWRDIDSFHRKADGFFYTADEYLKNHRSGSRWHQPDAADYRQTFVDYDVLPRLARHEIDEVWFFGGPYFGYHESAMAGPGAFETSRTNGSCRLPPRTGSRIRT
jgi:hypothetical protein